MERAYEWDGSFTGTVCDGKEVHSKQHQRRLHRIAIVVPCFVPVAGAACAACSGKRDGEEELENGHKGKGDEEQAAAAKGVDQPDRREPEEEVDDAKAHRGYQGGAYGEPGAQEDGGGIVCYDVDTAHLLQP